jgi:hypothetical protein
VFDDDHEELQACEANPEPRSALGRCAEQDMENWAKAKGRRVCRLGEARTSGGGGSTIAG